MQKKYVQKSIQLQSEFSRSETSKSFVNQLKKNLIRLTFFSFAALSLVACQTLKKQDGNFQFFSGKALIYDKIKQKQDWVHFSVSLSAPDLLRMDAFMGFLSIPLGSLVIQNESVVFVNIVEGKIYKTNKGSAVLEKLLKTNISPKDIIALFAGKYPLPAPWTCSSENNEKDSLCELKDLKVIRAREDQDKKMQIDSQRSKINFSYQSQTSGKTDFKINEPRNFEVIEL